MNHTHRIDKSHTYRLWEWDGIQQCANTRTNDERESGIAMHCSLGIWSRETLLLMGASEQMRKPLNTGLNCTYGCLRSMWRHIDRTYASHPIRMRQERNMSKWSTPTLSNG